MRFIASRLIMIAVLLAIRHVSVADGHPPRPSITSLTALEPVFSIQGSGQAAVLMHGPVKLGSAAGTRTFKAALSTYPNSQITYILDKSYATFDFWIGLKNPSDDDGLNLTGAVKSATTYSVLFEVWGDGDLLYRSKEITAGATPQSVDIKIPGVRELELVVRRGTHSAQNKNGAYAVWADPLLTGGKAPSAHEDLSRTYTVTGGNNTSVKINREGQIVGIKDQATQDYLPAMGRTRLATCQSLRVTNVRHLADGGMVFARLVKDRDGNQCYVTDAFIPTRTSIRWTTDIYSAGKPRTHAIITSLKWPATTRSAFWTAWSSPDMRGEGKFDNSLLQKEWEDPLVAQPFRNSSRWLGGNPALPMPVSGDLFSLPIATIIDPRDTYGFSLVQSPKDTLFYVKLITTQNGLIEFQRRFNRIGQGHHVRFTVDLVNHAKSWRSGLHWMVGRYPDYFNPVNPDAQNLSGCGAYSSGEGALDTAKLNKIGFKFNWKASFDFPYMGMFMPPVDHWQTFATPQEATRDPGVRKKHIGQPTSREQLEAYSKRMKDYGYYVLNYFNVTEFGSNVQSTDSVHQNIPPDDLWKNSTDFLYRRISDGILLDETGSYRRTWAKAIVMDPGGTNYQHFLIGQVQKTLRYLPSSAGICIDRMDWLTLFNTRADDGLSWYHNAPARSLFISWKRLMARLGPLMHQNGKVVFANPCLSMRLDVLKNIDGIYSEHNETGPGLNLSAFLGLRMPVTAWTRNEASLKPDPDAFFQRLLYMGVFPTAPIPYDNHAILPSTFTDSCYLEYGPLLKCMEKRQWVLLPHPVSVSGQVAKTNIFRVPDGYIVPVVLAAKDTQKASLKIDAAMAASLGKYTIDVLQPGVGQISLSAQKNASGDLLLQVPLKQGCAVVQLKKY